MTCKCSFTKTMFLIGSFLLLIPAVAFAQCQDQDCAYNTQSKCYQCQGFIGMGCDEKSCSSCTNTKCIQAPELVKAGVDSRILAAACAVKIGPARVSGGPSQGTSTTTLVPASYGSGAQGSFVRLAFADQTTSSTATLFQVKHTNLDFFATGLMVNLRNATLDSYRIGWVIIYTDGKVELRQGHVVAGQSIGHAKLASVPAQGIVPGALGSSDVRGLFFFVASATFADGNAWRANPTEMKSEALEALRGKKAGG